MSKFLKILILFLPLAVCFALVEAAYRIFDPCPYISPAEINESEYGNLLEHDALLGWRGLPGGKGAIVTANRKIKVELNSQGFRDIEHYARSEKPGLVFLGDSFTWGYEVEDGEMFVNRLRENIPAYEIYNLAQRGYGTDQSLLTFKQLEPEIPAKTVLLMFCDNDFSDNASSLRYNKFKPLYRLEGDVLILTGVPVPHDLRWAEPPPQFRPSDSTLPPLWVQRTFLKFHFLHDLTLRFRNWRQQDESEKRRLPEETVMPPADRWKDEQMITVPLIAELNREAASRGARLAVIYIPQKDFFTGRLTYEPEKNKVRYLCEVLKIPFQDLYPALRKTSGRTYYRQGMHWNARGHAVAAEAIEAFLKAENLI